MALVDATNYLMQGAGGMLGHTWSLAVEAHFYVLWPLLLIAVPRRWWVAMTVALLVAAICWRAGAPLADLDAYHHTDTRLPGLLLGSLLALTRGSGRRTALLAGAFALTVAAFDLTGYALAECAAAAAIVAIERGRLGALSWAPLVFTGRISYSLYLFHYPVAIMIRPYAPSWMEQAVILAAVSLIVAAVCAALDQRKRRQWHHAPATEAPTG